MTAACVLIGGLIFIVVLLFTGCPSNTESQENKTENEEYNKAVANYYRALAELYDSDNK